MKYIPVAFFLIVSVSACSKYNKQPLSDSTPSTDGNKETVFFPGEVKPDASKPCFQGAYYRKLVSSHDKWVGLNGTVVLPEIHQDTLPISFKKHSKERKN